MFWVLCRSTIQYSVLYLVFSECRFGVDNVLKENNLKEHAASSLDVPLLVVHLPANVSCVPENIKTENGLRPKKMLITSKRNC